MPNHRLIDQYLPDNPVLAAGWLGALHWALGDPETVEAFRTDTGITWRPGRTPIDRMIDEATGAATGFLEAFIPWFHEHIWGEG